MLLLVLSFSYHTTHGTESWTPLASPVNAMSGSTPLRVGSMFRLGSVPPLPTRGMPVCWKQKPPIAGTWPVPSATPAGLTPSQFAAPGPIGRLTKI